MTDTIEGYWVRLGSHANCHRCGLELEPLQNVWSDSKLNALLCPGCAGFTKGKYDSKVPDYKANKK